MESTFRKCLTIALSAAYGSVVLLGHGLHRFMPEDGHHHGLTVVRCAVHGSAHHDHHHRQDNDAGEHDHHGHHVDGQPGHDDGHRDTPLQLTAGDCVAHSHQCEICTFLVQLSSEQLSSSTAVARPLVAGAAVIVDRQRAMPTVFGWHSPRGPPAHAA